MILLIFPTVLLGFTFPLTVRLFVLIRAGPRAASASSTPATLRDASSAPWYQGLCSSRQLAPT